MKEAFTEDLETERLLMRRMTRQSWSDLASVLQDADVMYAYDHAFDDREVDEWLEKQLNRYMYEDGLGLLSLHLKNDGTFIGQAGLTWQRIKDRTVAEIGYLLKKEFWHCGYATEASLALRDYAFNVLGLDEVYSIIRDNNFPSQNVAIWVGMEKVDEIVKHYYGRDMVHYCYRVRRSQGA